MRNGIIYARYSDDKQNEQSIEGQLRVCTDFARANGINIVDTYIDRATTGTNDNRAAFQQMLSDAEKPVVWDIVLVYAIDRFGRSSIEISVNKYKLKKNHKTLISATQRTSENIDGTKNLDGILLENMYIGLAEYYSAELSQKVKRGNQENREKGLYCGGVLMFGYRVKNKKVYVDNEKAEIVRYIFQQYAEGRSVKQILKDLTARGITHIHNKPFAINTLYDMLRKEKYIGITRFSDGSVYDTIYPPIVPKPLFDEVQTILAKNKLGSKSVKMDYLLKGKCFCGLCGRSIQGECGTARNGSLKYYYKCVGRKKYNICKKSILSKDSLENFIVKRTLEIVSNPENISVIADAVMEVHKKRMHDKSILNILTTERDAIKKSINNIMKAIEQGVLTPTTKTRMEELEQQLADTEDKILAEQYAAQTQLTREQVVEYLTHTIQQEPKLIINTLIQKIVLFNDRAEIYYNYIDKQKPADPSEDQQVCLLLNGSILSHAGAPSLNSLNFFTIRKTFGLFCYIEEFKNFHK